MKHTLFLLLMAATSLHADFYVSTLGNDRNPGTRNKPFATLERARDAIRELKQDSQLPAGGLTVWIRGGTYYRKGTFALTQEDSGAPSGPIVYRALPGETVLLTGGREISGFRPIRDRKILQRIDRPYRRHILQLDLKALGITDFGKITRRGFGLPIVPAGLELFFDNRPMTLARWPNLGWALIAGAPAGKNGGRFTYEGDRPKRWSHDSDVWIHGYWTYDWADTYEQVGSIDTEKREIVTRPPHGVYGYTTGKRYYALNILEELDEPGEWYLDRDSGVLYFWPPAPLRNGKAYVSTLETPLLSLKDVSYVTLRGLMLEYTRGNAVEITGGTHDQLAGCKVRNIGNVGVSVEGGQNNGVSSCDISETGDGGIILSGGDRLTLTPGHNYAVNNHIFHYSRWDRTYRPAVQVSGVGNLVAHNLIHDAPHTAILLHGNDNIVEYNDTHTVAMETGDVGAYYMGRDYTERGNIIRYNIFGNLGAGDVNGVYLDDCASGSLVFGNVIFRAGRGTLIGGGRDNTIENNIFVDCRPAIHVDARGLNWAKFWFDGRDQTLIDRLKAVHYQQPPYSVRYPQLVHLWQDDPAVPKGNVIERNIDYGGTWLDLRDGLTKKIVTVRNNFVGENPHFVNPAVGNFQLKDDSPAWRIGFQKIPIDKIGLYKDADRIDVPQIPIIHTSLEIVSPTTVRLVVENLGRVPSHAVTALWIAPGEKARVEGNGRLSWSVAPGESASAVFHLRVAPGVGSFTIGSQQVGQDLAPIGHKIKLDSASPQHR